MSGRDPETGQFTSGNAGAESALHYPDGPYLSLSDREVQAIRIAQEDSGTGAEYDIVAPADELWPILSEFENRYVVVRMLWFYAEAGSSSSYLAAFVNDRAINRPPATPDAPDYSVNQGQGTNIVKFYASIGDQGFGSANGGTTEVRRPPTGQEAWFILDEDDDIFINWNYGASSEENHIFEVYLYYDVVEAPE